MSLNPKTYSADQLMRAMRAWHDVIVKCEGVSFVGAIEDDELREIVECTLDGSAYPAGLVELA